MPARRSRFDLPKFQALRTLQCCVAAFVLSSMGAQCYTKFTQIKGSSSAQLARSCESGQNIEHL